MAAVKVDVIIPVHNAESTIEEAVASAMKQEVPSHLLPRLCDLLSAHPPSENDGHPTTAASGVGNSAANERRCRVHFDVCVCCYDDASTDTSFGKLQSLQEEGNLQNAWNDTEHKISMHSKLLLGRAKPDTPSRGAGYARNQAAKLRDEYEGGASHEFRPEGTECGHFLVLLDSDDIMHPTRIAEQTCAMLSLPKEEREKTLMGCQFNRIPDDSTEHYTKWANSLNDDRVFLEQFRECTLLQPTWCVPRGWFERLGGYLEAPASDIDEVKPSKRAKIDPESSEIAAKQTIREETKDANEEDADVKQFYRLVHPSETTATTNADAAMPNEKRKLYEKTTNTLRLAEDTRFFYAHLRAGGRLLLHRTPTPLVSYRHRSGMSQSSGTPRKLLLKLRARAWEDIVFHGNSSTGNGAEWSKGFAVWGAGRDGKDFIKALRPEVAKKVVCLVDVDQKKIEQIKFYDNPALGMRIPILHFSELARSDVRETFGRVEKRCGDDTFDIASKQAQTGQGNEVSETTSEPKTNNSNTKNKTKANSIDPEILQQLPVVVCVAMYRTNGALESNVASIGRTEGVDLWHII